MADDLKDLKYELFEAQSKIIQLQKEVIDGLFLIIMLHGDITDDDTAAAVAKINEAAQLRAEYQL